MSIAQEDLIHIVEQASTVSERLGHRFRLSRVPASDDVVNARTKKWCQVAAQGNQDTLERRFAWDKLDLATIRHVLGDVELVDTQHLPRWVDTLRSAIESTNSLPSRTSGHGISQEHRCFNSQEPLPFEELLEPFIHIARQRLYAHVGRSSLISEDCYSSLERYLLERLTNICAHSLGLEFQIFRAYEQPALLRRLAQLQGATSREQYNTFVSKMLSGGLWDCFREYNVLARLVGTVTNVWVDNIATFVQRLISDWADIQITFSPGAQLGQVVAVRAGLSDLHNNGSSVFAVTFASGLQLIYKPRDLGLEDAFFRLLDWLNAHGLPQHLRTLQVLNRLEYGWVEHVAHLPCQDERAAERYYHRAGMLLCLLYTLSGADFHQENVIASGEDPVLIDLEMLMSTTVGADDHADANRSALSLALGQFDDSVLSTSFLPKWELGGDGSAYDVSGLGGKERQHTSFRRKVWQNTNTDTMVLAYERVRTRLSNNLPSLRGVDLTAGAYTAEIVAGFSDMYRSLIANRELLLNGDSPFTRLAHQRVRVLFRPSQVYASLLNETLSPASLRSGPDYSIAFEALCSSLLEAASKPHGWDIIAAEQQALARLDLPLFTTYADSIDLWLSPTQFIAHYFRESGYDRVIRRVHQLNEDDLARQIGFICSSLYTRHAIESEWSLASREQPVLTRDNARPLGRDSLLLKAVEIAREIEERAICGSDGSVTWMGFEYLPQAGRLQPRPMGWDFFDGTSGVGLFLAAMVKATDDDKYRELASKALRPICDRVQCSGRVQLQKLLKTIGMGAGKGIASLTYTLCRISRFLSDPVLVEHSSTLMSIVTLADIRNDAKLDLMSGTAGTILGLLACYASTARPQLLDLATACGHHLLNRRVASGTGYRAWATVGGQLLTGMSHGAAGIAYALLRLHAIVDNPRFLRAAEEALAYERSVFSQYAHDWPDVKGEKPRYGMSWCRGAPGIGLARVASLRILDTPEQREDIEVALQTTQRFCLQDIAHLCCGTFGRIEVLLVAAQILRRSDLMDTAQQYAASAIKTADLGHSFQLFPVRFPGLHNYGFFQGTAGIGYQLLRLADPEQFPSALCWE